MASGTFLKDWAVEGEIEPKKVIRYLAEIKVKYAFYTLFYVSAKTGFYYRYNEIQKSISQNDAHDCGILIFWPLVKATHLQHVLEPMA